MTLCSGEPSDNGWSFNRGTHSSGSSIATNHLEDSALMFMKNNVLCISFYIVRDIYKDKLQNSMYKLQSFHIMEYQSAGEKSKFMKPAKAWINT